MITSSRVEHTCPQCARANPAAGFPKSLAYQQWEANRAAHVLIMTIADITGITRLVWWLNGLLTRNHVDPGED